MPYPGDLLHEAGHVAVAPPEQRAASATLDPSSGDEMATLAWSYAALRHLELDAGGRLPSARLQGRRALALTETLQAAGRGVISACRCCSYYGMTVEEEFAAARGVEPFPHMLRWLR